jgi:hypothetical protein
MIFVVYLVIFLNIYMLYDVASMFHIAFGDFQVPIYLVFNCAEQETLFVYFF